MSSKTGFAAAIEKLNKAVESLDSAVDAHLEGGRSIGDVEAEVQRMQIDRNELAKSLDGAMAKVNKLEMTNKDVSRRLVDAMETIRSVVDR